MKLGIIGAMTVEVETLKQNMQNLTTSHRAGMEFYDGLLEGMPVTVSVCGVGKVNAALCVQVMCDFYGITHIVNTGVAGSLCNDLDIGDFVISRDAIYHDFDCHVINDHYTVGQVPGISVREFPANEKLIEAALAAAEEVKPGGAKLGRVASGDQFICGNESKACIVANTGASCTEMEGAAIAHAAWRNGIPFVIIRAISDKADDSAQMDFPTFEAIAARNCAAVTQKFIRNIQA